MGETIFCCHQKQGGREGAWLWHRAHPRRRKKGATGGGDKKAWQTCRNEHGKRNLLLLAECKSEKRFEDCWIAGIASGSYPVANAETFVDCH